MHNAEVTAKIGDSFVQQFVVYAHIDCFGNELDVVTV